MGISSKLMRGAQVLCGLLLACTVGSASAQQLVSSRSSGAALAQGTSGLHALDISADGRYVLFSNYSPTLFEIFGSGPAPENCRVYRKDRQTGKLLKVFESDPNGFEFCSGAKLSADGNRVAAAPAGPRSGRCVRIVLPDGNPGFDCGEFTALLVRDLATGKDEQVISRQIIATERDIIYIGDGEPRYTGAIVHSLSADAEVAVLERSDIIGGTVTDIFSVADMRENTLEKVVVQPADSNDYLGIANAVISPDGSKLAVSAVTINCSPDGAYCAPPPRWYDPRIPLNNFFPPDPSINRIYILDRSTGAQNVPAALDNLPAGITLGANAWSTNGDFLSWIEVPQFPVCAPYDGSNNPGCLTVDACEGSECELKIRRYNFGSGNTRTRKTSFDPETLSLCTGYGPGAPQVTELNCTPQLSRDGNTLLFGRAVKHPFGGSWQANPNSLSVVCVSKASLGSLAGVPEFIECPTVYPPFPYPQNPLNLFASSFSAPVNWYLQNLLTGHTSLVSIADAGQLFQSEGALLADNGNAAVFRSRDPRLNNLVPGATQYDESRLPEGCFWSPAGSGSNLLVATNDNTRIGAQNDFFVNPETPDFYTYPETPVFCPVSYPVIPANLYAVDIVRGVNLAARTPGNSGIGTVRMQTWIENPGRKRATMLGVDITITGLGAGGRVRVAKDTPCEIYPATAGTNDDSLALRCELPALAAGAARQLRWSISSDKRAAVTITTAVSSNEQETRPADNTDIAYAVVLPRSLLTNSVGGVR